MGKEIYNRLTESGVELRLREMEKIHSHKLEELWQLGR